MRKLLGLGALALMAATAPGCARKRSGDKGAVEAANQGGPSQERIPKVDKGVDPDDKILRIGALNDESGPAAAIGKPYAAGKRLLAERVNAGGSGLLPAGWKIELVEKDHHSNPQRALQQYDAIKDDVLFIGTSFGTLSTMPLCDMLERDGVVAFPALPSAELAKHRYTPPLGPSYEIAAMRAMDWAVEAAGGANHVKAGIVYQKDDYGKAGLDGWKAAAQLHGLEIVSEQTVAPGQKDCTAVVTALEKSGANYVLLATLASSTGPIVETAAKLHYEPTWIGETPSWIDAFFNPQVTPSVVFAKFYVTTGLTYWGEDVPGMAEFQTLWDRHKAELGGTQSWYILASYLQGLIELEAFDRALERGDATRAGYLKALQSIDDWNAGGMMQPISLASFPYPTSARTRVLQPDFSNKSWSEVGPYAEPAALETK